MRNRASCWSCRVKRACRPASRRRWASAMRWPSSRGTVPRECVIQCETGSVRTRGTRVAAGLLRGTGVQAASGARSEGLQLSTMVPEGGMGGILVGGSRVRQSRRQRRRTAAACGNAHCAASIVSVMSAAAAARSGTPDARPVVPPGICVPSDIGRATPDTT
ncbi:hypothetical protein BVIET440_60198 [Burkholderia vietnamiensis]|nr:hypothetical protein BVI1335_1270011 [Burkholderia vietnamiensis]